MWSGCLALARLCLDRPESLSELRRHRPHRQVPALECARPTRTTAARGGPARVLQPATRHGRTLEAPPRRTRLPDHHPLLPATVRTRVSALPVVRQRRRVRRPRLEAGFELLRSMIGITVRG